MDKQVSVKSYSRDDVDKVELELGRMENALHDYYCDAGKVILETAETEGRKINELVERIIETRKRLVDMREEKGCSECGTYNDRDSLYCKRCGQKLDENGDGTTQ